MSEKANHRKKQYHHGDLKEALITAGLAILAEGGAEALSLRETARRAGVSHSAPYRHFQNKEQLIGAIAAEGFRRLTKALSDAIALGGGRFHEELRLSGRAYVEFALNNPEHLKVMFSIKRFVPGHDCIHGVEDLDAFARIAGVFERAQAEGIIPTDQPPPALALLAWAQVHGMSHILIEKQIPPGTISLESALSLIDSWVVFMCRGLKAL
ncbi:MAG: TetR/AcrR family transcriptional regulator [Spirochaetales bacterium]|nr:TetR/AcrR family transcriptional regulator [Spirochaetales bacterium]